MDNKFSDEELFALHKKKTERVMRVIVTIIVSVFIFTLYFLLGND